MESTHHRMGLRGERIDGRQTDSDNQPAALERLEFEWQLTVIMREDMNRKYDFFLSVTFHPSSHSHNTPVLAFPFIAPARNQRNEKTNATSLDEKGR